MRNITVLFSLFFVSSLTAQVDWGIGTKWTYNLIDYDSIVGKVVHKPTFWEISDSAVVNGIDCYALELDGRLGDFYVRWEGNDVFFYDTDLEEFVLVYSFGNDSIFSSRQFLRQHPGGIPIDYTITIDTTYPELINGNTIDVSEYRYEESDSLVYMGNPRRVYENIGFEYYALPPFPIAPVSIGTIGMDALRCFENHGQIINFKDYDCDSIFALTTSVQDPYIDLIKVSPNPSSGEVMISNAEGSPYSVVNALGQVVQQGVIEGQPIVIASSGLYSIVIEYKGARITRQVVVQ